MCACRKRRYPGGIFNSTTAGALGSAGSSASTNTCVPPGVPRSYGGEPSCEPTAPSVMVGVPGFEPGASASRTLRANQAAPHPVGPMECSEQAFPEAERIHAAATFGPPSPAHARVDRPGLRICAWLYVGRVAHRVEDRRREVGAADQQVGQVRVGLVVDEGRTVDARAVTAGGRREIG